MRSFKEDQALHDALIAYGVAKGHHDNLVLFLRRDSTLSQRRWELEQKASRASARVTREYVNTYGPADLTWREEDQSRLGL